MLHFIVNLNLLQKQFMSIVLNPLTIDSVILESSFTIDTEQCLV